MSMESGADASRQAMVQRQFSTPNMMQCAVAGSGVPGRHSMNGESGGSGGPSSAGSGGAGQRSNSQQNLLQQNAKELQKQQQQQQQRNVSHRVFKSLKN